MGENKVKGGKTVSYFEILTHNLMYEWIFWPRDQDHFFFNITHSSFLAGLNMKDLKSFEAKKKKKQNYLKFVSTTGILLNVSDKTIIDLLLVN